jgi:hypothetical protein
MWWDDIYGTGDPEVFQKEYEDELTKWGTDIPYGSLNQNVDPTKTVTNKDGSTYFYSKTGDFLGGVGSGGQVITSGLLNQAGAALKNLFGGTGDLGKLGQLGAFGGLAALARNSSFFNPPPAKVGFQGTIPQYTYERQQTPLAQQRPITYESITPKEGEMVPAVMRPVPYRPGQGGITYFTPGRFMPVASGTPGGTTGGTTSGTTGGITGGTTGGITGGTDRRDDTDTPETIERAAGGMMPGGIAMLAKGRYLKGNGDGVSDSIPARFSGSGQEARLADGEFVIPARVVSELGNGSSDAGARKLYAMLDRVEARAKKAKRGKPSGADRELKKLA